MILKLLLIIAVITMVYFIFFKSKPLSSNREKKQKTKESASDEMVQCAECDVYVEMDEAILSNGKYYCSNECLRA